MIARPTMRARPATPGEDEGLPPFGEDLRSPALSPA